jgi:hypothetical protein
MTNNQITTITFFSFKGLETLWMFPQMRLSIPSFSKVDGLQFFKLLGSGGKRGFSILPNFNTYAFLGVWDNETKAHAFFQNSDVFNRFSKHAAEHWTVFMYNVKAHGAWSGINPFSNFKKYNGGIMAVITRATIKPKFVAKFWRYVPQVSDNIYDHDGLLFSIGIGEYPLFMQATFSIWKDQQNMRAYAYKSQLHREVIKKTRELGWYQEELFSNFIPYHTMGSWKGKNPISFLI